MSNKQDYQMYLASRDWGLKKRAVRERSGGTCERCHLHPHTQTHHLTYANLYKEPLEDLLGVCAGCHEFLSGTSDTDPAEELQELRQWIHDRYADDLILAFRHLQQNLVHGISHIDRFNRLIQIFILEQEKADYPTAVRLAEIKLNANRRFYEVERRYSA